MTSAEPTPDWHGIKPIYHRCERVARHASDLWING
jgi:hypothetical protein